MKMNFWPWPCCENPWVWLKLHTMVAAMATKLLYVEDFFENYGLKVITCLKNWGNLSRSWSIINSLSKLSLAENRWPFLQHFFLLQGVELKRWMYLQPWTQGAFHKPQGWWNILAIYVLACHLEGLIQSYCRTLSWLAFSNRRFLSRRPLLCWLAFYHPWCFASSALLIILFLSSPSRRMLSWLHQKCKERWFLWGIKYRPAMSR